MTPAVSVVVTAYNYGRFLGAALGSLVGQTFGDFEAVVIDDGSTDDTSDVVRPFLRDRRLRYHRTERVGQPAAKNLGVHLTSAPIVAFLDADDVWLPTKLQRQVALFEEGPGVGVVYGPRVVIDEEGFELDAVRPTLYRGHVLAKMIRTNFVCFSSCAVRRAVFDDVGLFDERIPLAIDYDLWLRVARRWRFDHVEEPVVKYRTGHANLSRRRVERVRTARAIVMRFLDEHGGRELVEPALVRRVLAENCIDMGAAVEGLGRGWWFVRALGYCPVHPLAWHSLAGFWWPDRVRRFVRRLAGRPDWQTPRRVGRLS